MHIESDLKYQLKQNFHLTYLENKNKYNFKKIQGVYLYSSLGEMYNTLVFKKILITFMLIKLKNVFIHVIYHCFQIKINIILAPR